MIHRASFCGVILAAGASTRMGTDKALLAWPPSNVERGTLLSSAIHAFAPFNDLVIVVAGKNVDVIKPVVHACGGYLAINPEPERGQFSSLQCGLQEVLNHGRDAAMITLVDRPPVGTAVLGRLRAAFEAAASEVWAVVPEYDGRHGHPFLAGREMIEMFLKAPATSTAREVEHQNQQHLQYVPVDDPHTVMNVNTPEEYAALLNPQTR